MTSTNGAPAPNVGPTSGALTRAASRLQKRERAARLASGAISAPTKSTRLSKEKYRRRLPSAQDLDKIAALTTQGLRINEIARGLRVSNRSVMLALKEPDVVGRMAYYRELLRGKNVAAAHAIAEKAWTKAEDALDAGDAKSFDAYMRGIHAKEKVAASSSGENQRIEVTHQGVVPTEPIKIQLQQLIALVREETQENKGK